MFAPTELTKKVFLIDEVHMLTKDAFNALLKLLEEPPLHAMFILATTESAKIIPTVMSRCARFDFKPLDDKDLSKLLNSVSQKEKIRISQSASEMMIRSATGSARDLLSLLGQAMTLDPAEITDETIDNLLGSGDQRQIPELIEMLIDKNSRSAITKINEMLFSGYNAKQLQEDSLEYLRYLLLAIIGVKEVVCPQVYLKKITDQTKQVLASDVNSMIKAFLNSAKWFNLAPHPALPLEIAIVEICGDSEKDDDNSRPSKNTKEKEIKKETAPVSREETKQPKTNSPIKTEPVKIKGLEALWEKVLERMQTKNYSLYTCLRMCRPLSFTDENLLVGCKYGFHKERMQEIKQKGILIDLIKEITGDNVQINFEVKNDLQLDSINKAKEKEEAETDPLVADAKNAFAT
ncbi:MAG: hypothetical protein ACD_68C00112G0004 [uncultured bacterium]|nr:MAG: hypothetical protein ACD_68C00112G0004 [uncultured bacterium]